MKCKNGNDKETRDITFWHSFLLEQWNRRRVTRAGEESREEEESKEEEEEERKKRMNMRWKRQEERRDESGRENGWNQVEREQKWKAKVAHEINEKKKGKWKNK